ncbi:MULTISPECIES: type II secretion system inner membrane protein GspF [unclassified Arsukibacterium]|uniref:type II secretion system inner membrane protein GspF n=1 Tax=unclassified Arsukibacterium TaxID=2635278 RepID=UPI000C47297E|nr:MULTISPECIES: type II secretion system inner membrane protein GspF [unclassified Arsukibacterium]MAA94880.1 type II secretion system protein GspF [Rheinheimera sp.]MBM34683.1 type II secretion system protein GspF [Rheinheimera sp.]HAW92996.1 type II secretion system protein GspF [Candidatus Azambacteria bacterium]|tara:strand:+ start:71273 stop:72493 length:1221 start_codon:yes stop_codon:yes gene_type:complete
MAAFEYQALDLRGKKNKGVLEADNARHARQLLREQKLQPLSVELASQQEKLVASGRKWLSRKISASELALLTRQLATLVEAALPIESALLAVAEQCEKPRLQNMMMAVRSKVVEGYTLAEGLAEFPHVFDHLFRSMVAAGEKSGHLEQVLNRLADYTEQRQHMRSQVLQALLYPIILTFFAVLVISILLAAVVPKIVGQFEHMGQSLPGTTLFLIAASDFIRNYGIVVLIALMLAAVFWQRALRKPELKYRWDRFTLRLGMFGKVSRGLNTARFARTLSILNASSVPLLEAMRISADVLSNSYMKEAVTEATGRVREGTSLRNALEQTKMFPPMMLHMIASGEKSGQLDSMLERAANAQDKEFETLVTVSLKVFEPVLVSVMAGMVLFIVMAILQPILALNNMVGG